MNEQQGCHHSSRYPPRQCPGVQHHRNISPASPNWPPGCPCPTQASPKVPAGFGPPRSSGTRRDWTVSPLSLPPSPGLFPSSPKPLHPASSPGTQTHTGLRRGDGGPGGAGGKQGRDSTLLAGLPGQAQAPGRLGPPGSGAAEGVGGRRAMPPERSGPQPHPARAAIDPCCSCLITEENGAAGGARRLRRGRGGLSAPWPGLNIYCVLFGLWGRGRRAVASVRSCRRGGARRLGLGSGPAPPTEPPGLAGTRVPLARPLPGRGFCSGAAGPR